MQKIEKLIRIANELDKRKMYKQADQIDSVIFNEADDDITSEYLLEGEDLEIELDDDFEEPTTEELYKELEDQFRQEALKEQSPRSPYISTWYSSTEPRIEQQLLSSDPQDIEFVLADIIEQIGDIIEQSDMSQEDIVEIAGRIKGLKHKFKIPNRQIGGFRMDNPLVTKELPTAEASNKCSIKK